ncbi:MAG: catalase, partial [Candidatus Sericytochromatia bacterium]
MHRPFLFVSLSLTTALTLAACQNLPQSGSQRQQPQVFRAARAAIPIDTALGESLAPNEAALTESIETVTLQGMQKEAAKFPMTRDVHAKQHGCVRAFVDVDVTALPPQHRVGVFAHNQTYPAWIRYSNGMGKAKADADGDVRGFGLKLMGVPGAK